MNSLYSKIALTVIVVLLFFFLIFVSNARKTGKELLNHLMCEKAHSIMDLTESTLAKAMREGKYHGIKEVTEGVINSEIVKEVYITDMDGKVVIDVNSNSLTQTIDFQEFNLTDNEHNFKYVIKNDNGIYYLKGLHTIKKEKDCKSCHTNDSEYVGYLVMGISMAEIQKHSEQHQEGNILITIITLLGTGIALFIIISFVVVKPIKKLSLGMREISFMINKYGEGQLDKIEYQYKIKSSSEINQLQESFGNLITELNRTYNQIKEMHSKSMIRADQLAIVGEMAASIAHEIKNPIAGIQSAIEILKSELDPQDPNVSIFEEIHLQLKRVNKTINDLLNYARPSKPVFLKTDLNYLIRRCITLLTPQLQSKRIHLDYNTEGSNFDAEIDEKLIQQVIFNVVFNSLDAVNESGKIKIKLSSYDSKLQIKISDNGCGIPEEIRKNIFKPFFTTKHKGTGLGLAISKKIIDQHSGSITLETNQNEGTTFIITIPVRRTAI